MDTSSDQTISTMTFYCTMQQIADEAHHKGAQTISDTIDLHEHSIKNMNFIAGALKLLGQGKLSDEKKKALEEHIRQFQEVDFPKLLEAGILREDDNPIPTDFDVLKASEEQLFDTTLAIEELSDKEQRVLKKAGEDLLKNSSNHHTNTLTIAMGAQKRQETDDMIRAQRPQGG